MFGFFSVAVSLLVEQFSLNCLYARLNNETGEWKHHSNPDYRERKWLGNISYGEDGSFNFTDK